MELRTVAYAGWPVLEFRYRVQWNERQRRLKLAVPTVFEGGELQCEIPGGSIARPPDGQEHVHGRWFLIAGEAGGKEVALGVVNSGQHGLDGLDGEVRLSVLRSAAYCHEQGQSLAALPGVKFMDQGLHEFRLLVTAGEPDEVRARLPGLADWLDAPPLAYAHLPCGGASSEGGQPAAAANAVSLLSLEPASVRLVACKRSSDGEALVLRLHEACGRGATARVVVSAPAGAISTELRPHAIKTLRIERDGSWREVDAVDER
jgi:alpha-mannosidase